MTRNRTVKSFFIMIAVIVIAFIMFALFSPSSAQGTKLVPHIASEHEQDFCDLYSHHPSALDMILDVKSDVTEKIKIEVLHNVGNSWKSASGFRPKLSSGDFLRIHTMKSDKENKICIHHKGKANLETFQIEVEGDWGDGLLVVNSLAKEIELDNDPVAIALLESPASEDFTSYELDEYPDRAPTQEQSYLIVVSRLDEAEAE